MTTPAQDILVDLDNAINRSQATENEQALNDLGSIMARLRQLLMESEVDLNRLRSDREKIIHRGTSAHRAKDKAMKALAARELQCINMDISRTQQQVTTWSEARQRAVEARSRAMGR